MNQFQYVLKMKELERLKTKKDKAAFIRGCRTSWRQSTYTYYDLLLLINIQKTITDESISGVKSLQKEINSMAPRVADITVTEIETLLTEISISDVTAGNDFGAFWWSSGVPAFLKLIVKKAMIENEIN